MRLFFPFSAGVRFATWHPVSFFQGAEDFHAAMTTISTFYANGTSGADRASCFLGNKRRKTAVAPALFSFTHLHCSWVTGERGGLLATISRWSENVNEKTVSSRFVEKKLFWYQRSEWTDWLQTIKQLKWAEFKPKVCRKKEVISLISCVSFRPVFPVFCPHRRPVDPHRGSNLSKWSPAGLISSLIYCGLIFHLIPFGLRALSRLCSAAVSTWCRQHTPIRTRMQTRTHARTLLACRGPEKTKPGSASVNTAHCYGHSFPPRIFAPRGDLGLGEVKRWHSSRSVELY